MHANSTECSGPLDAMIKGGELSGPASAVNLQDWLEILEIIAGVLAILVMVWLAKRAESHSARQARDLITSISGIFAHVIVRHTHSALPDLESGQSWSEDIISQPERALQHDRGRRSAQAAVVRRSIVIDDGIELESQHPRSVQALPSEESMRPVNCIAARPAAWGIAEDYPHDTHEEHMSINKSSAISLEGQGQATSSAGGASSIEAVSDNLEEGLAERRGLKTVEASSSRPYKEEMTHRLDIQRKPGDLQHRDATASAQPPPFQPVEQHAFSGHPKTWLKVL